MRSWHRAVAGLVVGLAVLAAAAGSLLLASGRTGAAAGPVAQTQLRDEFGIVYTVLGFVQRLYYKPVESRALVQGALKGMVQALGDPYSIYLERGAYEEMIQNVEGRFSGVGVNFTLKDGYVTVISPLPGTPAERAGLRAGDRILKVDGADLSGLDSDQVMRLIRGPEGTKVVLEVWRADLPQPFTVELIREMIDVPSVEARVLEPGIGYLQVTRFFSGTGREFEQKLAELQAQGIRGLVLDLRNNAGGLLDQAVDVAGHLVPEGPVVYVINRAGKRQVYRSQKPQVPLPLVVLVNGGTASAAEIVAGAVQDWQTGTLVGTRTFGKGVVQSLIRLGDYGGIKLTTAEYYTPIGRNLGGSGLDPDVAVAEAPPAPPQPQPIRFSREMRPGLVGLDVLALQEHLAFLGFDPGPCDGVYGPRTAAAVKALEARAGLRADGRADAAVVEAVAALEDARARGEPLDPQLAKALEILRSRL
ncbi:MAG: S41 family peptidase [Acetobacteraceae bacterium]|nr:S41 family peptidase [Acetobacteraceae bacterium]